MAPNLSRVSRELRGLLTLVKETQKFAEYVQEDDGLQRLAAEIRADVARAKAEKAAADKDLADAKSAVEKTKQEAAKVASSAKAVVQTAGDAAKKIVDDAKAGADRLAQEAAADAQATRDAAKAQAAADQVECKRLNGDIASRQARVSDLDVLIVDREATLRAIEEQVAAVRAKFA